jgi:hypothetical protein
MKNYEQENRQELHRQRKLSTKINHQIIYNPQLQQTFSLLTY